MNQKLRNVVERYFGGTGYYESTRQIMEMKPSADDFSDELLDSFDPNLRKRLYGLLPVWCAENARAVWERRVGREPDALCARTLEALVRTRGTAPSRREG